jgi:hypothetical protein
MIFLKFIISWQNFGGVCSFSIFKLDFKYILRKNDCNRSMIQKFAFHLMENCIRAIEVSVNFLLSSYMDYIDYIIILL